MTDPRTKQIKIQTGVVKRIIKEKSMYEKEFIQIENRIEKMKTDGKDEYDIRKMGEVLAESKMMVPDCTRRLLTAVEDLRNKISECENDMTNTEEYKEAVKQLKEAEETIQQN